MIGSVIRRKVFWFLDTLRGAPIRKHYEDIRSLMSLPEDELSQKQSSYIEKLIEHAEATVPYYANIKSHNLEELPVISKATIKENYEQFQSSSYLHIKKHSMSTSGSTGTPFTVLQDMNKRHRVLAELIYFNEKAGQQVGDRFVFTRVWTNKDLRTKRNNFLSMFAKNEIPFDIANLDDKDMEGLRALLKKDRAINEVMGYPSTLKRLYHYLERCGDSAKDFTLKLIVTGSEMLESAEKINLQKMFNCVVISRYSNQENGVIAQQCKHDNEFHVNSGSYYVELLDLDEDVPAEPGKMGRIVVTDLFNYAMPMIRYDTGDLAIAGNKARCGWNTRILESVEGRRVDVCIAPDGRMLSPFLFDKHMEKFDQLLQFQFVQKGKNNYVLKINDPKGIYKDDAFYDLMYQLLGRKANCKVERVEEIPCVNSGKFKQMICESKD